MILVTGATGNVGRHVVAGLRAAGRPVRTLSRRGGDFRGDLRDPPSLRAALDGVDAAFLLWPGPSGDGAEAAAELIAGRVRRIVYLSAHSPETGFWGVVEKTVERSGADWTFLRAGGFATNTLAWADMIRAGEVRWPYGEAARPMIHERDIAEVAVRALTGDGHVGARYELTGPANVTQAEQARLIGAAVGREVRWTELDPAAARRQLIAEWGDEAFADGALAYWASLVGRGEPVTSTVEEVTGHPARTFAEWARDHADDFR
jgi:uncharacterized protein YbjT (DUF2867 family)